LFLLAWQQNTCHNFALTILSCSYNKRPYDYWNRVCRRKLCRKECKEALKSIWFPHSLTTAKNPIISCYCKFAQCTSTRMFDSMHNHFYRSVGISTDTTAL
jgi:hypothetical protein